MIFIGDVGLDCYLINERRLTFWGGCSLNAWAAARELSPQAKLLSKRSLSESYPKALHETIKSWPISNLAPPTQEITVDHLGERHLGAYREGALAELSFKDFEAILLESDELIAVPLYAQTKRLCLEILEALSTRVPRLCLDVGTMIDFEEDISFLTPYLEKILLIQSSGRPIKLNGMGEHLHLVRTSGAGPINCERAGERLLLQPPPLTKAMLDSTGAGDYFFGRTCTLLESKKRLENSILLEATHGIERILCQIGPNLLE